MANLAALLDKEAGAEIEAILSEAQNRASEIIAKAKADAEAIVAQKERALLNQHDAELVRAKSAAQLEAASLKLRSQHQVVQTVFDQAKEEINALIKDPKRYQSVLLNLLSEAVASLGDEAASVKQIFVNPNDKDLITAALKKLSMNAELKTDQAVVGGVKLVAKDASVTIENTLSSRLNGLRDDLAAGVSQALLSERQDS